MINLVGFIVLGILGWKWLNDLSRDRRKADEHWNKIRKSNFWWED